MGETIDLTGEWRGHYVEDGGRHPIAMRVDQRGARLRGTMSDEDTLFLADPRHVLGDSLDELQMEVGDDLNCGGATSAPATSTIAGTVTGRTVSFTKRYDGTISTEMWIGALAFRTEVEDHEIYYHGVVGNDGVLRGTWSSGRLDAASDADAPGEGESLVDLSRGAFEMRRADA